MQRTRADRAVEGTLLFAIVVHLVALLTMAGGLLPAMPGSGLETPQLRAAYVAAHPWLWHLGWLPWYLSALSDLAFSLSLVAARWVPRKISIFTLFFTVLPFVIEQYFETIWDIAGPTLASSDVARYAALEQHAFLGVCVIAASLYAVMAIGWSYCISFAMGWTKPLTVLTCTAWPVLFFAASAPILPHSLRISTTLIKLGNQIGFALLMVWFVLALELVLQRTRLYESWGGTARWRLSSFGLPARLLELTANSRALRYLAEFLPGIKLSSDIQNVVISITFLTRTELQIFFHEAFSCSVLEARDSTPC